MGTGSVIIGAGSIAATHAAALRQLGVEVTCAVGRNEDRTRGFATQNGIHRWTTDVDEALSGDESFVHICTPPAEHAGIIRKALAAGKNIVCEKPLCISAEEAENLAAAARESGLITALCCNVRYYPANIKATEKIRAGETGRPLVISGSYMQEFHVPPHQDGWRFNDSASGGQRAISEIGTHWIDLAHTWTGRKITAVNAVLGKWYPVRYRENGMLTEGPDGEPVKVSTEDAAAVILEFEGGAIGTLLLSEVSKGHVNDLSIEVSGPQGTLRWEEWHPEILLASADGELRPEEVCDSAMTGSLSVRDATFLRLFRDVYAAAEGRKHGRYPDFDDGAYIARVCAAIKESGESGTRVTV